MNIRTPACEGSLEAKLLVLAEAPGSLEILKGRPLIGPSGEVFEEALKAAGLNRADCYILNIWPFRVNKNKTGTTFFDRDGRALWTANDFTEAGLEAASETLARIRASKAHVIVTLGQQAAALAAGKTTKIMKWRGSVVPGLDRVDGRKVCMTIHPAATLHGTELWKYFLQSDLRKAAAEAASPLLQLPERDLRIRPSFDEAIKFMHECREAGAFATDIEVINHQVSCFSLCHDPLTTLTIPFTDEAGGHYWSEADEAVIWHTYGKLMADPKVAKINQNLIGFDAPFLLQQNNIHTRGFLGDTMIAQHILYPEFPKGLDFIASVHTREPYYKDEGKLWKNQGGDWPTFWRYCGKDAAVALEAWNALKIELDEGGFWKTYELTAKIADPLMFMTARGLAIDSQGLAETKASLDAELKVLEAELVAVAARPFNPGSSKQCADYFYGLKKLPPYLGKSGSPTTDDKAMSRIFRKTNLREAKLVQEIRALRKLKTTYVEVALDADGRLRCSWNPRGTWTGRLSSSQTIFGTGMNLQNLHPAFKGFIVAG